VSKVRNSDKESVAVSNNGEQLDDLNMDQNHKIPDFTAKTVGDDEESLIGLNEFFNNSQIKSELHWFTHRDTLERAAERDDRRLYYIAPRSRFLAGLMLWCESRVLEPHQAQIRLVAVDPGYRNYGLGSYLVAEAIDFAHKYRKEQIIADVAAESFAVEFWTSCGFSKIDDYHTDGGRQMIRMNRATE
jgi:GNAT superfamily N-acetyltransferase